MKSVKMLKPTSQPCLRNQDPIFQTLQHAFAQPGSVLELACGTAQHGVYFSQRLPHLAWQPTDMKPALPGAALWIEEASLTNLLPAMELDVSLPHWNLSPYNYVYSANLVHFVSMDTVKCMFMGIQKNLKKSGVLALYGPYNNQGFTSGGNASLDNWLKQDINPEAGIKELSVIIELAQQHNLQLQENHMLPANNHLLIFEHTPI